jgi:hypothetical protein
VKNNGLVSSCYSFSCGGRNNLFFDEKEKISKRTNSVIRPIPIPRISGSLLPVLESVLFGEQGLLKRGDNLI